MTPRRSPRLFLLLLLGLWTAAARTVFSIAGVGVFPETAAGPAPTPQSESQETCSGGGSYDVTTRDPPHDLTDNAFTFEYEDTTHSQPMDRGDGVLGPGAIAAIVIAVILGASVLIALVVITLKRFTTA